MIRVLVKKKKVNESKLFEGNQDQANAGVNPLANIPNEIHNFTLAISNGIQAACKDINKTIPTLATIANDQNSQYKEQYKVIAQDLDFIAKSQEPKDIIAKSAELMKNLNSLAPVNTDGKTDTGVKQDGTAEPAATTTPAQPAATTTPVQPAATTTPAQPAATTTPAQPAATTTPAQPAATTTQVQPAATNTQNQG